MKAANTHAPSVQNPGEWPLRVLLVVSGESPQVITETVYALALSEPRFVPTRVMVLTTALGRHSAQDALLRRASLPSYAASMGWWAWN